MPVGGGNRLPDVKWTVAASASEGPDIHACVAANPAISADTKYRIGTPGNRQGLDDGMKAGFLMIMVPSRVLC